MVLYSAGPSFLILGHWPMVGATTFRMGLFPAQLILPGNALTDAPGVCLTWWPGLLVSPVKLTMKMSCHIHLCGSLHNSVC